MTMTKTKRDNLIKVGTMKMQLQQIRKWKKSRSDFNRELDNELLDKIINKYEKLITYFEKKGVTEFFVENK